MSLAMNTAGIAAVPREAAEPRGAVRAAPINQQAGEQVTRRAVQRYLPRQSMNTAQKRDVGRWIGRVLVMGGSLTQVVAWIVWASGGGR
jgi:predicted Abi (CAAX) family protease